MTQASTLNVGAVITSTQYGLSVASEEGGGTPIVGMKDIQDGRVNLNPEARVNLSPEDFQKYRLLKGDILLNRTNSPSLVGKAAIVEDDADVVFASYLVRLTVNRQKASPEYINFWLNSDRGQKQIKALATRAVSQANLNPTTFCEHFYLPIPDLCTQQNIAAALKAWDDATAKLGALIVALERRKQGWMQQLLTGRRRLKGFKGKWKPVRLGTILERVTRKNTTGCLTPLTVSAQRGLVEQSSYFAKQIAATDNDHYLLLQRGEFAYNRSASAGYPLGAIKRLDSFDEGIVSTLCLCFRVADVEKTDSDFLVGLIEAGSLNRALRAIAHEGARSHGLLNVTATDFFDIRVNLPDIAEQRAMAAVLRDMDAELALRRSQLEALKTQKRALMQKLLSGEWRLPEVPAQSNFTSKKGL